MTGREAAAEAAALRASLATLRDVAGIAGSFVCTQSGRLVAREIASVFEDAVLAEAGSRLCRVSETFAAGGDEIDVAVVRYGVHRLYMKAIAGGMLCILAEGPVNMPALRMAANLVGRRIAPSVARAQAELPPLSPDSPGAALTPAAAPAAPARQAPPGMRRFRGRELT